MDHPDSDLDGSLSESESDVGVRDQSPVPLMINPLTASFAASLLASSQGPGGVGSHVITSSSPSGGSGSPGTSGTHLEAAKGYTFEEQFKQLYELSDDPKRKEFLDDLFSFMQKRGTPVNRIPIMAKQVLDLYELYNLVVERGGLVEVINKKIWREITKGLNLPSSITSAAFTLRTQYMKYLYAYECEKEGLSTQDELQAAIDGNRREGRRSGYGSYSDMVGATPPPTTSTISRSGSVGGGPNSSPLSTPLVLARSLNGHHQSSSQALSSSGEEDSGSHPLHSIPAQAEALNLEVKGSSSNNNNNSTTNNNNPNSSSTTNGGSRDLTARHLRERELIETQTRAALEALQARKMMEDVMSAYVPPAKRFLSEEERYLLGGGYNSAHIKLSSRVGKSQLDSGVLEVSMDINGVTYTGVLSPAPSQRSRMS